MRQPGGMLAKVEIVLRLLASGWRVFVPRPSTPLPAVLGGAGGCGRGQSSGPSWQVLRHFSELGRRGGCSSPGALGVLRSTLGPAKPVKLGACSVVVAMALSGARVGTRPSQVGLRSSLRASSRYGLCLSVGCASRTQRLGAPDGELPSLGPRIHQRACLVPRLASTP